MDLNSPKLTQARNEPNLIDEGGGGQLIPIGSAV
jgi:hypothetical protein